MKELTISQKSLHHLALASFLCQDAKVKAALSVVLEDISDQISDITVNIATDDDGVVVTAEFEE